MERINLLRKNLVYPERLELAALMRGPRAAGGEGAWRAAPAQDGWGRTPRPAWDDDAATKRSSWMEMAAEFRKKNDAKLASLRHAGGPTSVPQLPESGSPSLEAGQESQLEAAARDRMSELLKRFAERAARSRSRVELPLTPSSDGSTSPSSMRRIDDDDDKPDFVEIQLSPEHGRKPCLAWWDYEKCPVVIDPHGIFYLLWLVAVTLSYCYNSWVIPFRWSFPYQTPQNTPIWLTIDSLCDIIYLVDVAVVKPRLSYLSDGFWVQDPVDTRRNYIRKIQFKMDLVSLLPLEVLYAFFGTSAVFLRIPRFFKVHSFSEFYISLDRVLASPFIVRIGRTLTYIFYLIHLNACAYYKVSTWEGIGSNGWVFSGAGNAYIRCFYFATKTATSIGKNPKPENEMEYIFMTFAWLMGVFVFALMIGQIRDIIATATRSQTEYRKLVDETMEYMRRQNLPSDLQRRVTSWFNFTWEQQHTLDESHIINALPINLKTDVAINVHIQTLSKVQLFIDCDQALLRDLVLKLRPVIFLPGDIICRKGEVGKEMYIVKMGEVQVMGGKNNNEVLATLSEGSVFGEISLLAIDGANRRTADVRSKGFSNLFLLSKMDLNSALVYHPEAQEILRKKAKSLVKKNAARKKEPEPEPDIIIANPETPEKPSKLLQAVMEVVPEESGAGQLLRKGSRVCSKRKSREKIKKLPPKMPPPKAECACEKQRRKSLPKSLRHRKLATVGESPTSCPSLFRMRNCSSEPCLKKNVCKSGGTCCCEDISSDSKH